MRPVLCLGPLGIPAEDRLLGGKIGGGDGVRVRPEGRRV